MKHLIAVVGGILFVHELAVFVTISIYVFHHFAGPSRSGSLARCHHFLGFVRKIALGHVFVLFPRFLRCLVRLFGNFGSCLGRLGWGWRACVSKEKMQKDRKRNK